MALFYLPCQIASLRQSRIWQGESREIILPLAKLARGAISRGKQKYVQQIKTV